MPESGGSSGSEKKKYYIDAEKSTFTKLTVGGKTITTSKESATTLTKEEAATAKSHGIVLKSA